MKAASVRLTIAFVLMVGVLTAALVEQMSPSRAEQARDALTPRMIALRDQ